MIIEGCIAQALLNFSPDGGVTSVMSSGGTTYTVVQGGSDPVTFTLDSAAICAEMLTDPTCRAAIAALATSTAGDTGPAGASAYDVWLSEGNSGTVGDFISSLVGPAGTSGTPGTAGASAYDIWLQDGNSGTMAQFLASLVGPAGQDGSDGTGGTSSVATQGPVLTGDGTSGSPVTLVIAALCDALVADPTCVNQINQIVNHPAAGNATPTTAGLVILADGLGEDNPTDVITKRSLPRCLADDENGDIIREAICNAAPATTNQIEAIDGDTIMLMCTPAGVLRSVRIDDLDLGGATVAEGLACASAGDVTANTSGVTNNSGEPLYYRKAHAYTGGGGGCGTSNVADSPTSPVYVLPAGSTITTMNDNVSGACSILPAVQPEVLVDGGPEQLALVSGAVDGSDGCFVHTVEQCQECDGGNSHQGAVLRLWFWKEA